MLETLYYICSKYKWSDASSAASVNAAVGNTALDNPSKLVELYQINPAQYEWIALNERCKSQAWRDLESLFERKVIY